MTVSRAQVLTNRVCVFLELIRWQVTSYLKIEDSSLLFDLTYKFINGSFAALDFDDGINVDLQILGKENYPQKSLPLSF